MAGKQRKVLVTGGGTFLGDSIARALLQEGAEVTLLVRAGAEDRLGLLANRTTWWRADVWDSASMRGRARGHHVVIHTVGSTLADPIQGLTHHRLNFVSARNVATMCVSDGVPTMFLLSSARAPWLSRAYIKSKREAENYLARVGIRGVIIRAPVAYPRGVRRQPFFAWMSLLGRIPPISWLGMRRIAPMPVDVMARGIARIVLDEARSKSLYYANDLWRNGAQRDDTPPPTFDPPSAPPTSPQPPIIHDPDATPRSVKRVNPFDLLDEDTPFGWSPPSDEDKWR